MMTLPFWLSTEHMAKLELAAGVKANAAGTTTQFGGDVG